MILKLTEEQRQSIQANTGDLVEIEDEHTQRVYVLVEKAAYRQMIDETLRQKLQVGFDEADAGDVADWDVEEILAEAHRRFSSRAF